MDAELFYRFGPVAAPILDWVYDSAGWVATNKVLVGTMFAPIMAAIITYKATMRSAAVAELARIDNRDLSERQIIHTENVEQTDAMTRRFEALMDGYDKRVDDLLMEVTSLRTEVISLRKVLDRQRTICHGCDRFMLWNIEASSATTA